ncbi:MAG: secondary thiamine-phosphate synthase enzyme YjbQ [Euryarchaeota archaeon]|nr:secondary thiamine-phosphate synthase enzyme YjbQ [Euryarchaeota archaeon]
MKIRTTSRIQLIDITASLNNEVADAGIGTGMAMAYSPHTTTAVIINENEPGLKEDILKLLYIIVPQGRYMHDRIDNNARSHLQAVVLGNNVCMPVEDGKLALGTWQSVFFVELDGPRHRKLTVRIVGTGK